MQVYVYFKNFFILGLLFTFMPKLEKMFGGSSAEKAWKDANKGHISQYNKNHYRQNKSRIQEQRKIQRATSRKNKHNDFLGF